MEHLISMLVAISVFAFLMLLSGSIRRRALVLSAAGLKDVGQEEKKAVKPLSSMLWNVLDRLGETFPPRDRDEDHRLLREAGLEWRPSFFRGIRLASGCAFSLLLLPLGILALPLLPLAYAAGSRMPLLWVKNKHRRALEAIAADLPELVDLVAVLCYAGENLQRSFQHSLVAAEHPSTLRELGKVAEGMRLGEGVGEALGRIADHPCRELRRFARTVRRAEESGAPIAETLEELATEMRSARREKNRVQASRVSVLILFPLVFLILPSFLLLTVGSMIIGHTL